MVESNWTRQLPGAVFFSDQWSGPAVQRKPVRMLLSNWHSTAKSRVKGPSGGISLLIPSTRATIVVRLVADASLLAISMVAPGKARCMMSAQRPARPTSRVTLQPAPRQQTRPRTVAAELGWHIAMIVLGARVIIKRPATGAPLDGMTAATTSAYLEDCWLISPFNQERSL
jgi:hypothetical protein